MLQLPINQEFNGMIFNRSFSLLIILQNHDLLHKTGGRKMTRNGYFYTAFYALLLESVRVIRHLLLSSSALSLQ